MLHTRGLALSPLFFFLFTACVGGGGGGDAGDEDDDGGSDEEPAFMEGSATVMVGPEGGELELGELELIIPAGALSEETEISVEASSMEIEGFERLSAIYALSPSGLSFAVPATLRIDLDRVDTDAKVFRGEELGDVPQPIETQIAFARATASISGFSYYLVGKRRNSPIGFDDDFEYEGSRFTASPVAQGAIGGYSYDLVGGAGIFDGEAMNGRVWFADDYCLSFRPDGTGVLDDAGGTDRRYDQFPSINIDTLQGGFDSTPVVTAQGMQPVGAKLLDPEYDRTSELRSFRWGVRVNEDGTIYETSDGYYLTMLVFDDGSLAKSFVWDPVTNAPTTSLPGIGELTQELPSTQHFCRFREFLTMTPDGNQSRCVESIEDYSGGLTFTKSACYSHGVLEGPYSMTDMNGKQIEAGQFANNRAVGGWSFSNLDGVRRATGNFSEDGMPQGEWTTYDYQGMLESVVTFKGGLPPTGRGTYYRMLSGLFTGYLTTFDGTSYKEREGSLLDGKRTGPWYFFSENGTLVGEEHYDVETQIPNGEWCYALPEGGTDCVPISFSWKDNSNHYDWGNCVGGVNTWTHNTYDMTGSVVTQECYELTGTFQEPVQGPSKSCGSVCSQ